ncbi:cohesin complex subunit [Malassezia yamatoensis]|uniref:Cohesin complex subunit n=1 Tax=Malassezia yamatoensis TaxID=253288 RepID=A0AAJ5Z276_9BASI|nr:cohesin complex subunit [Malassezia yamatoensis]
MSYLVRATSQTHTDAILSPDQIDSAAENWVVAFQGEPVDALASFVSFVLRMSGCDATISNEQVQSEDLHEILTEIQSTFAKVCEIFIQHAVKQYPIVSRSKPWKNVRKYGAQLMTRILHDAAEAEILNDDILLPTWQAWLSEMAQSSLRSFRHTSTLMTMWVLDAIAEQLELARESFQVAERQRTAEASKSAQNRTRVAHTAQRMDVLDSLREILDANMDELVTNVLVPRYKDVDAQVRQDCNEQLGNLMKRYPSQFLQEFYFRLVGSALSDVDAGVRLKALAAMRGICVEKHASSISSLVDSYKKRLLDAALYDVDRNVRTSCFALLESINHLGMLEHEHCSILAIHVFDFDPAIRVAAANFLCTLLEHSSVTTPLAQVQKVMELLQKYNQQLTEMEQRSGPMDHNADEAGFENALVSYDPVSMTNVGRIGVATEALWDVSESLRAWQPYVELLDGDQNLSSQQEAAAVEMLATIVRLTRDKHQVQDNAPAIEACSHALIPVLPRLLVHFSAETIQSADLLQIIPCMDLSVFQETKNMHAFDRLWDEVCVQISRHIDSRLLHNAAQALKCLADAPAAVGTRAAKLITLQDALFEGLQDLLNERTIETAVLTEDDVHKIHAILARFHALLKSLDVAEALLDTPQRPSRFQVLLSLAKRGRLGHESEQRFVALSMQILTLFLLWKAQDSLQQETTVDSVLEHREQLLEVLHMYLEQPGQIISRTDDAQARLYLACPPKVQLQCANSAQAELNQCLEPFRKGALSESKPTKNRTARRPPSHRQLMGSNTPLSMVRTSLQVCALSSTFITAIKVGALDVQYSAVILHFYAHFDADFDAHCQELVHVLRDDALHAGRAWIVSETLLSALQQLFLLYADETSEAHFVALARHLANATMLHGPGFSIVQAIDADPIVTLHVAGTQKVLEYWEDPSSDKKKISVFYKGLIHLLVTVSPKSAMQIHATIHQRFSAAHIQPEASAKEWDAFFAYEKRLLTLAAKDAELIQGVRESMN